LFVCSFLFVCYPPHKYVLEFWLKNTFTFWLNCHRKLVLTTLRLLPSQGQPIVQTLAENSALRGKTEGPALQTHPAQAPAGHNVFTLAKPSRLKLPL
jgi:hypothetical protein